MTEQVRHTFSRLKGYRASGNAERLLVRAINFRTCWETKNCNELQSIARLVNFNCVLMQLIAPCNRAFIFLIAILGRTQCLNIPLHKGIHINLKTKLKWKYYSYIITRLSVMSEFLLRVRIAQRFQSLKAPSRLCQIWFLRRRLLLWWGKASFSADIKGLFFCCYQRPPFLLLSKASFSAVIKGLFFCCYQRPLFLLLSKASFSAVNKGLFFCCYQRRLFLLLSILMKIPSSSRWL